MEPVLVDFHERKVIGMGKIGEPVSPGDAWPALFARIHDVTGRVRPHETIGLIKRNEHGYLAGVEVESLGDIPAGMFAYLIPAGRYAKATHRGPIGKIGETFEKAMEWLGANRYEQFDVVCFEIYDERFKDGEADSELDMYIQAKPL